jgi:biotin transport system substrate-specific component
MLCGLTLGARKGMLSQLFYVAAGAIGIPVFAQGKFGIQPILGVTGGYIVSFAVVAWILGQLAERDWTRTPVRTGLAMLLGSIVNLGMGSAWLATAIGGAAAMKTGVLQFVLPELMKAMIVLVALPSAWKWVRQG